jgi:hypothetical protein
MLQSILQEAQKRILSSRILSGGQLTSFLQYASNQGADVSERELIDASLDAGMYAHLGRVYQFQLNAIIGGAGSAVVSGLIQTPRSLREYLDLAASQIPGGYDAQKVAKDLLIDARQKGLYKHLDHEDGRLELLCDLAEAEAETVIDEVIEPEAVAA